MNFKKGIGENQNGFQLAPMVDIMFLLLIFFMVSSIYYQLERNLEVQVPEAESGVESGRQSGEVIINIDKSGNYYINNIKMSVEGVEDILRDVADKHSQTQPIIIRCDRESAHKHFVRVFDIVQKLGIADVRIATDHQTTGEKAQ
jgi:biopolymer transport protein ExbD